MELFHFSPQLLLLLLLYSSQQALDPSHKEKHLPKTTPPFMDIAVSMSDPDEALNLAHIRFQLM